PASGPGNAIRQPVPLGRERAVTVRPQPAQFGLSERRGPALWVSGHAPMFGPPRRPGADKARSSELSTRSGLQDPVTAVPALSSRVVMTCPLAESARTDCRGEDGSVLMPRHDPGLRCRGLPCGVLRRRLL